MYIVESGTKHHNPLILKQDKHKEYEEMNKKDNTLHILCVIILFHDKDMER